MSEDIPFSEGVAALFLDLWRLSTFKVSGSLMSSSTWLRDALIEGDEGALPGSDPTKLCRLVGCGDDCHGELPAGRSGSFGREE